MSKEKIRFIHSFSTFPIKNNIYNISGLKRLLSQVWYFATSVAYLKRVGATVVLHTDTLGKQLLGHIPYDEVHLTLDDYDKSIHHRFWAAGKFMAIRNEKPPFIHIDGDVFIKSEKLLHLIEDKVLNNDLFVQSDDPAKMYAVESPMYNSEKEFCEEHYCTPNGADSYNTGIMGVRTEEVRNALCYNYLAIVKYFSENYKSTLDSEVYLTPDLIAEQKMVRNLCETRDYKVDTLLKSPKDAVKLDYQHVYTTDKIIKLDLCKETLKLLDEDLYKATSMLCD